LIQSTRRVSSIARLHFRPTRISSGHKRSCGFDASKPDQGKNRTRRPHSSNGAFWCVQGFRLPIIYRSQLDSWLLVVLPVAVIACVGAGVVVVSRNASLMGWLLAGLVAAPGAVLPLRLLAST
jgi:hypothetical protein